MPSLMAALSWAPARGGQGGQPPTLEKIRVGHAHPENANRGPKTFRQQFVNKTIVVSN